MTELDSIDQFAEVDQVTDLLDAYFHGGMHVTIANAGAENCSLPPYLPPGQTCTKDSDCTQIGPCDRVAQQCAGTLNGQKISCRKDSDCGVCLGISRSVCTIPFDKTCNVSNNNADCSNLGPCQNIQNGTGTCAQKDDTNSLVSCGSDGDCTGVCQSTTNRYCADLVGHHPPGARPRVLAVA